MDNAQQPLDNAEPTTPGAEPVATPSENNNNIPHDVPAEPVTTSTPDAGPVANPPEKSKAGLIIMFFVILLVVSGAIAAVFLLNNNADDKKKDGETAQEEKKDEEEEETVQLSERQLARNAIRENTIVLVATAARDYQMNNKGKTPFGSAYDKATIGKFVSRYIDDGIDPSGVDEGKLMVCKNGEHCSIFEDASMNTMGWTIDKAEENKKNQPIKYSNAGALDYLIHVYVGAQCGDNRGTYSYYAGDRHFALFYLEEGNRFICADNTDPGLKIYGDEPKIPQGNDELSKSKRRTARWDLLMTALSAANDYQTNNNGKTPFGTNSAIVSDYTKFVQRYIEPDVSVAKFGETTCSEGKKCQKFVDPDGTVASFKVYKQSEINQVLAKVETANKVDHVIYVGVGTKCSSDNKSTVPASSDRVIALFYVDETTMLCSDNR